MERVVRLLDTAREDHSYRQALVRLWVLASHDPRLNAWEQTGNERSIEAPRRAFLDQLQDGEPMDLASVQAHPLALIRALDDYLASTRVLSRSGMPDSYEEDGASHWLVPVTLQARRGARLDRQPARLARWFHRHAVLPSRTAHGIEVVCIPTRAQLDTCLDALVQQPDGQLKVWIAHFDDGADVVWDQSASPIGNWRCLSVANRATRWASILDTLARAQQAGAHVVVFPEFALDLQHREQLAAHLRRNPSGLQLVVAGAFHEPMHGGAMDAYNTAPVFDADGRTLFSHRKLRLFGSTDEGAEFVQVGNRVHVLVSPVGAMTVLICKDFMDEDPRVDNLLAEVPVDWVWVPSYGNEITLRLHKERAKKLARLTTGTSCAVAQTQNTAIKQPGQVLPLLPGFGHPAGQPQPCDVPAAGGLVAFALTRQPPALGVAPRFKRVK